MFTFKILKFQVKKSVLEAVESGATTKTELSRCFKIDRKSVRRILETKDAISNTVYDGRNSKRTKFRPPKHEELEEVLVKWLKNVRSQNFFHNDNNDSICGGEGFSGNFG